MSIVPKVYFTLTMQGSNLSLLAICCMLEFSHMKIKTTTPVPTCLALKSTLCGSTQLLQWDIMIARVATVELAHYWFLDHGFI